MAFADDSSLGNVPILHWGHHVIRTYNMKGLKEPREMLETKTQDWSGKYRKWRSWRKEGKPRTRLFNWDDESHCPPRGAYLNNGQKILPKTCCPENNFYAIWLKKYSALLMWWTAGGPFKQGKKCTNWEVQTKESYILALHFYLKDMGKRRAGRMDVNFHSNIPCQWM